MIAKGIDTNKMIGYNRDADIRKNIGFPIDSMITH